MYPPPAWKPPGGGKATKKSARHSAVMATTRAATFSAKIRTLSDFHARIVGQQQPPSSAEIVTTLRYFQQTLVGFLKELPADKATLFEQYNAENTIIRASLYPNLNYSGLFYGIVNLLDVFPMLSSAQPAIAEAILDTLKALYFFVDRDCIDQMPLLLVSQLGVFPSAMDRKLVHLLCDCILPYAFGEGTTGRVSVPAVLMLTLHHSADPSLHTMAVESLMCKLPDLYNDLLTVIASGTSESRISAVNLLFHYWPLMNPAILHRKSVQYKVIAWSQTPCQNVNCAEKGPSVRRTFEPLLCANLGETAPPISLCHICADAAPNELPMRFLCQPLPALISATCQNKGCSSANRIAVGNCFDEDCIRSHAHIPLRLCQECFSSLHASPTRASGHCRHSGQSLVWGSQLERTMVEAIVKLLRETSSQLIELSADGEAAKRPKWLRQLEAGRELGREIDPLSDERRMLSRFGIWLMAAHCPPGADATPNSIGYLLSVLFQWFATTALLPNDAMGQSLEQLKSDFACEWLNQALAAHYEVFVSELLPQQLEPIVPGEEVIWDIRAVRREQMREGLGKLLALAPYDVISLATWSRVMPHWLHALNTELLDEQELMELKVPLSKLFEPDLCPLPFEARRLFEFLSAKLQAEAYEEVLKGLDWLHLLTRIDIRLSLDFLLDMFSACLRQLPLPLLAPISKTEQNATEEQMATKLENIPKVVDLETEPPADDSSSPQHEQQKQQQETNKDPPTGPLAAQLIMTDILAQQIKLSGGASAITEPVMERLFSVVAQILQYQAESVFDQQGWGHTCQDQEGDQFADCLRCQQALFLYQVLLQVVEQFCPKEETGLDSFVFGDNAAREFTDWLSEASSSAHQQQQQQQQITSTSPRLSPSPHALSSSSPGQAFFASPIAQRRQKHSASSSGFGTIKARQEVSTPGELVGVLPSEEVDTVRSQAAMTIADQSPLSMAYVSATVLESAAQARGISAANGPTAPEAVDGVKQQQQQPPTVADGGERLFWDTSLGRFRFSLDQMPAQLRLTYVLLSNVEREPDPDVQYFLMRLLKYLFLHRECLAYARREQEHRGFLVWLQENLLIPRLWTLLRSDYSHVGQMAVPLILHAITLPLGEDVFWDTVNSEFTNASWQRRLKAVDRVLVLAQFAPAAAVRSNRVLQTSLSCAFSHLVVSAHDPNPAIAQKALLSLEALPHGSHVLICQCLEAQFDSCILDRPLIISRIRLLSTLLPEETILIWDFFIQRFETLALEAQLKAQQRAGADTGGQFVQDLLHTDPMSELYQRKVTRARQSLNEADSVRSIVRSLRENSLRHQLNPAAKGDQVATDPPHHHQHKLIQSTLSAASSMSPLAINSDYRYGRMREFTDEESNLCLLLNRVVDMQNPERHTLFLVVSLFVQFLAGKKCGPADNAKKQSVLLRHFNTLLGYSNADKCFTIPPARLRRAAVCNAFLHGLPEVLDSNLLIGNQLLSLVLQLLLYLPSPQKFASDAPTADYSLRLLSGQQRHCWLHSVITILYKYRCDGAQTADAVRKLMLIVVQTLEQQCHKCAPAQDQQPVQMPAPQRRSGVPLLEAEEWESSEEDHEESNGEDERRAAKLPSLVTEKEEEGGSPRSLRRMAMKEDHKRGISSAYLQRPESLRLAGGIGEGKDRLLAASGKRDSAEPPSDAQQPQQQCVIPPPAIALHPPPPGIGLGLPTAAAGTAGRNGPFPTTQSAAFETGSAGVNARLSCGCCGMRIERFDEETLSLCCVALCTFLHSATNLAAPLLPRTLRCVARFIDSPHFPWHESNVFVPGNARSAAKQLVRVILLQLSGSGIALQLFNLPIQADELFQFWSRIVHALADFPELNPIAFLQNLLEDISDNWPIKVTRILHNVAVYIQSVPLDALSSWTGVVSQLDALYRRMLSSEQQQQQQQQNVTNQKLLIVRQQQIKAELSSTVLVMSRVMRVQNFAGIKGSVQLVESFAKWLVEILHRCAVDLRDLLNVCTACNRGMIRERDKQILTRALVSELVASLKFKCELAEPNYLIVVRMVLQDFGEPLGDDWAIAAAGGGGQQRMVDIGEQSGAAEQWGSWQQDAALSPAGFGWDQFNTGAAEAIRPHVPELLEFIADMHVLTKLKKQSASNSDRVGGDLKAGLAEIIALEMSRPSIRDSRTVMRFIPWLYSPPSLAQALPGQFAESVANVRVLSWILLGALHARGSGIAGGGGPISCGTCLPVPIACSGQMADYIHFVLAGFADQSKQSVVHMSALFHAFHLCQLWTIYCEQTAAASRSEETLSRTIQQILDFWARVTPAILQLLSHSKVLADMVNLHFVNTLQALQQLNSAVLCQLYPMWEPVLTAYHAHVPRQLRMKLDAVEAQAPLETPQMRPWLSKVRYKISQIELQTSAASPFYNV